MTHVACFVHQPQLKTLKLLSEEIFKHVNCTAVYRLQWRCFEYTYVLCSPPTDLTDFQIQSMWLTHSPFIVYALFECERDSIAMITMLVSVQYCWQKSNSFRSRDIEWRQWAKTIERAGINILSLPPPKKQTKQNVNCFDAVYLRRTRTANEAKAWSFVVERMGLFLLSFNRNSFASLPPKQSYLNSLPTLASGHVKYGRSVCCVSIVEIQIDADYCQYARNARLGAAFNIGSTPNLHVIYV